MNTDTLERYRRLATKWPPPRYNAVDPKHLQQFVEAYEERDRAISLLREIATTEDHVERCEKFHVHYHVSCESIQRHVRQKLEEWGIKWEGDE